jgi:outer membrane protein OmpA-like peptidoglycan-associated protein
MKIRVCFMLTFLAALPLTTSAQVVELNGAYTHMSGDGGLDGFNLGAAAWFTHRISLAFDYDSAWDTSHLGVFELTQTGLVVSKSHLQNFLAGPRLYFPGVLKSKNKHFSRLLPFGEVQLGLSHLSASLESTTQNQSASDNAFTWMLGGGADYRFSEHWASRLRLDFLRTHFAETGQSRVRFGVGIMYSFGGMGKAEEAADAKRKAETQRAEAQARQEEIERAEARRRAVIEQAEREKLAVEQAAQAKHKADMDLAAAEARNKIASQQLAAQEASENPPKDNTQKPDAAAVAAAQGRAQGQQEAMDQATREKEALRARLLEQFNRILPTTDTPRGLVVDMNDIMFDTGKADIRPEGREDLARFVGIVLNYPLLRFAVEGYTDNSGTPELNQAVSTQRANTVRDYLVGHGLDASSISAQGLGMNNPIADNNTAEGRQKNRRVEIIVSGEAIGTKIGR